MDIEQFSEQFFNRLTELRNNKGVSARDMSLSLGQAESYINKIENKKNFPSMTGFYFICEYLEITPMEYFINTTASPKLINELIETIDDLSDEQIEHLIGLLKGFKDI